MEPERNRYRTLSKDGTGTVKNSYGSTTLIEVEPCTGVGILDVVEDPLHDRGIAVGKGYRDMYLGGEGPGHS